MSVPRSRVPRLAEAMLKALLDRSGYGVPHPRPPGKQSRSDGCVAFGVKEALRWVCI